MAHLNKDIVDNALALSANERVALVEKLLESLDTPNDDLNTIWANESEQRVQAYDHNQISSKPASEVLQKYK